MICPKCQAEYEKGIKVCADCEIPLVAELQLKPEHEHEELVTVFSTTNNSATAVAESILRSAGISYFIKGRVIQDLLAWGLASEIQVSEADVETARELLKDL